MISSFSFLTVLTHSKFPNSLKTCNLSNAFYIYPTTSFQVIAYLHIQLSICKCWPWTLSQGLESLQHKEVGCSRRLPVAPPGCLALAGLWCSEAPGASPSTSWKLLLCLPHIWWICMAASRSATRSRSCWARWALSCLISNYKKKWEKLLEQLHVESH